MGAYYNAIRAYNLEHPDSPITYKDDLPMPYSMAEVESFKSLAKSIYGAYDKSTRAMMDHMALGMTLGMFSTWMNGIYTNYMMKPGSSGQMRLVQATDSANNLLFFDKYQNVLVQVVGENGETKYYYEGTNQEAEDISILNPVMDKVPEMVQGIWYTIADCGRSFSRGFKEGNILKAVKEDIWMDPM